MVYVFLADGYEEIEALTVVDILRRGGVRVAIVGVTGGIVTGAHGISVNADISVSEVDFFAMSALVFPGGMLGTENLGKNKDVMNILALARENDILTCAICAAPSILGEAGYLRGISATCFPGSERSLDTFKNVPVIRDGNIITARSAGSAHLFAFEILRAIKDGETADRVRSSMIY